MDYPDDRNDELSRNEILSRIQPGNAILNLRAQTGIVRQMNFRGPAGHVCGIEADARVYVYPFLGDGNVGLGEQITNEDETFNLVLADNVVEYLAHPKRFYAKSGVC